MQGAKAAVCERCAAMALLRGTAQGLQVTFDDAPFEDAFLAISDALSIQPDFYRGSTAHLIFRAVPPSEEDFHRLLEMMDDAEIAVASLLGNESVRTLAEAHELVYGGSAPPLNVEELKQRRIARKDRAGAADRSALSEAARSLSADFAGARADLATRRTATVTQIAPSTHYHRGTVRSGQVLRQLGHIVVIGDVNPGAELIASGDIVIFGTLRGQAHAGAQGDRASSVTALELSPTQLRIATLIATGERSAGKARTREAGEVARIEDDRIVVVPISKEVP